MDPMEQLIESVRREQVILFLGSGFSLRAGAPSGKTLVKAIKKGMTDDQLRDEFGETRKSKKTENSLAKVAGVFERLYDRRRLLDIVEQAMEFKRRDMSDHDNLKLIPHFQTIITTNYDTLLEDVYGDNCHVIRNASDCVNKSKNKVQIYKIHGDFNEKEHIILTDDDYTNFFVNGRGDSLWSAVKDEMLSHDVLFIGYSLDDPNIIQLLKEINNDTRGSEHRYYLAVPDMKGSSGNKLEKEGVIYFNAIAKDILPRIIEVLKKTINKDYIENRVSLETYIKYCHIYGINPIIKPGDKGKNNAIERYEFLEPGKVDIHMTSHGEKMKALKEYDLAKFKDKLPSILGGDKLPALSFDKEELDAFSLKINGLTVGDKADIKQVIFAPRPKAKEDTLQVASIGFNEKVKYEVYGDGKCAYLRLNTEICKIGIVYNVQEDSLQFNMATKDVYKDNSEALKWVDFLVALFDGEIIKSINVFGEISFPKDPNSQKWFKFAKKYYKSLSAIEIGYGVSFDKYDNYTPYRLRLCELLLASKDGKSLNYSLPNSQEYSISVPCSRDGLKKEGFTVGLMSLMIITFTDPSITLCGMVFSFRYRYMLLEKADVTKVEDDGAEAVQVNLIPQGAIYEICSNKELNEVFNLDSLKLSDVNVIQSNKDKKV